MIFTLFNVFEERHNLERAVASVDQVFGHRCDVAHVFIDGAYPEWRSPHRLSEDGTREFAFSKGHLIEAPDTDECEKRTLGLRYIDTVAFDGDWVLYLDADETITSFFAWPVRVGYFSFTRKTHREIDYGRCRLYRWEPGLEFKHRHYDLYDRNGELVSSLEDAPDYQTVGTGDHFEKPRTKVKNDYFRILREREGHFSEPRAVVTNYSAGTVPVVGLLHS